MKKIADNVAVVQNIARKIRNANRIILSTHRDSDGDGLGSQLALYHTLKKANKDVRIINPDRAPAKYSFLNPDKSIQYFDENKGIDVSADLVLILDTNDRRLMTELFEKFQSHCPEVLFIDHHPPLSIGPSPTENSWIDTRAASTGEMIYELIMGLGFEIDEVIARCLYTSITFDTQLYRYVRSSSKSHRIAAELLQFPIESLEVHRALFGNQSIKKMSFFARTITSIQYSENSQVATFCISKKDLQDFDLNNEDARDVIDMVMNIDAIEVAVMIRQDQENEYKISLRSKGKLPVLELAEILGGGGHIFSAGAYVKAPMAEIQKTISGYFQKIV